MHPTVGRSRPDVIGNEKEEHLRKLRRGGSNPRRYCGMETSTATSLGPLQLHQEKEKKL
jgi:hypothetical protein